jgi:signal transduction histidine kinase/AraC-like DNA-binding protein/ABC-type sugar transport system substrate-binding protein
VNLARRPRIGSHIVDYDPFWVQVRSAVTACAPSTFDIVAIAGTEHPDALSAAAQSRLLETCLAADLDALIAWTLPERLVQALLDTHLPVVLLSESSTRDTLFVAPDGLRVAALTLTRFLAERIGGHGRIVCVGGFCEPGGENGRSRLAGVRQALAAFPEMTLTHIPADFRAEHARSTIADGLCALDGPVDAVIGLTDSLALAAREIGLSAGVIENWTPVGGINGDPLALAAIVNGDMTATLETSAAELGQLGLTLAIRAASGGALPSRFAYTQRLITGDNVRDASVQKLVALAALPAQVAASNRAQIVESDARIARLAGVGRCLDGMLERCKVEQAVARAMCDHFDYESARIVLCESECESLRADACIARVLESGEAMFVADLRTGPRPWPEHGPGARARAVLAMHANGKRLGVLDLQSRRPKPTGQADLADLQVVADQVGATLRACGRYAEAVSARKKAEDADRVKSRLLANVSHELRAPLNVILGYTQAALSDPNPYGIDLPSVLRHDLDHIFASGDHLMRLINDLLDLSRAEVDALDLFPESIATREFLEEVFHAATGPGGAVAGVTWRLDLPIELPPIAADRVRVRQVLDNLLSNAKGSTSKGEIVLGAVVDDARLHIWVSDTGDGIPREEQARIFEPFVSGERVGRRRKGVGLGLAIARRLVALHDGSLLLDSEPGRGSTFHVRLPLRHAADAARGGTSVLMKPAASQALLGAIDALQPAALTGEVLIVDDDPAARLFYTGLVRQAFPACTLSTAENGTEALNTLRAQLEPPILVILDLVMPDMDGFTVLERLRANARTCHVPVLVVSGRLLSLDDVRRLDHARVLYQAKDLLSPTEAVSVLKGVAGGHALLPQPTSAVVKQALAHLHEHYRRSLARHELAVAVGVSDNYLSQIFHRELGLSPWEYLTRLRIHRAKELLVTTEASITHVAGQVGFDDPAYFSRVFHKHVGESPQMYRHEPVVEQYPTRR